MKYSELESLMNDIYDTKFEIKKLDDKLNDLSDIKEINCNVITISGKDYCVNNYHESSKDFSKSIYDSLVTYYTNLRKSYYEFYNDKMNKLKSVCDKNKTIDFNEEIIKLMI